MDQPIFYTLHGHTSWLSKLRLYLSSPEVTYFTVTRCTETLAPFKGIFAKNTNMSYDILMSMALSKRECQHRYKYACICAYMRIYILCTVYIYMYVFLNQKLLRMLCPYKNTCKIGSSNLHVIPQGHVFSCFHSIHHSCSLLIISLTKTMGWFKISYISLPKWPKTRTRSPVRWRHSPWPRHQVVGPNVLAKELGDTSHDPCLWAPVPSIKPEQNLLDTRDESCHLPNPQESPKFQPKPTARKGSDAAAVFAKLQIPHNAVFFYHPKIKFLDTQQLMISCDSLVTAPQPLSTGSM